VVEKINRLYKKNELLFAILWIVMYVVLLSLADNFSVEIGVHKLVTVVVCAALTLILVMWMKRSGLYEKYGLCKSKLEPSKLLYYIPLVLLASVNLWFGVTMNYSPVETVLYAASMLFVGFLEEVIFRGLLFKAMSKDGLKSAIIVSSVTFGIGHIVNLINGSGADIFSNLLQVGYAIAAGFAFTMLFHRSKSLWACIITHGVLNALSVFANEGARTPGRDIFCAVMLTVISLAYAGYLTKVKTAKEKEQVSEQNKEG